MSESLETPESPKWIESIVDHIANCMEAHSPMGPLGFEFNQDAEQWEVIVYPTSVELAGGPDDGAIVNPGFALDINQLNQAFDEIIDIQWVAHGLVHGDAFGPHVSLEGIYQGNAVYIQIHSYAPDDEPPGMILDTSEEHEAELIH